MTSKTLDTSKVHRSLASAGRQLEAPVVTIGNFDGVHIGHQAIFRRVAQRANRKGVEAVALTFAPHPVRFFRPDTDEFRLTTDEQKFRLILEQGIDEVVALRFDENLASLGPDEFVETILHQGLGASEALVGTNFAFGKGRTGTTDDLQRLCSERGIETELCEKVEYDGDTVSSTRIRNKLEEGRVAYAAELLGRRHRVSGKVVEGDRRGRELGYPTANLRAENLLPSDGIYATYLHVEGEAPLPSASSIGVRPVFDGSERTTESYVLDRDDLELYGREVELEFVEFVRPERDFDSPDALVEQMEDDVDRVRAILDRDGESQ